jgi:hypothetical protein
MPTGSSESSANIAAWPSFVKTLVYGILPIALVDYLKGHLAAVGRRRMIRPKLRTVQTSRRAV